MIPFLFSLLGALAAPSETVAEKPGPRGEASVVLHDGWTIAPLGRKIDVGTFPMAIAPLPGNRAAVLLCGYGEEGVDIVDLATGARQRLEMPKAWLGLAASSDGKTLYASGGADNVVRVFAENGTGWREKESLRLGAPDLPIFAAGLALDEPRERLYVCENMGNRLAAFDLRTGALVAQFPTGSFPYEVRLDTDGSRAFVSNWGSASVSAITLDGSRPPETWVTGSHPTALLLDPASKRLLIACAADDRVTALDTLTGRAAWNASVTLHPNDLEGTTPTSLARAPDGRFLVANSDNNDVAAIDASGPLPRVDGFLPVGRYPTAIAISGESILVLDGKGSVTRPAPDGPQPSDRISGHKTGKYILARQNGDLRVIPLGELDRLSVHTRTVLSGVPTPHETKLRPSFSKIHHVIYVIRENRTYDQVFGDDKRGNGDPSLVLFGNAVTPNAHALERAFTLLDNFYCNAEVSADGHNWSTAAFANDYVQKTYPQNYSDRGRPYDYDGTSEIARPRAGYLWDAAARIHLSYRSYGEFIETGNTLEAPGTTALPGLREHFDPRYRGWDLAYTDVDRVAEWRREFQAFERSGELPALEIISLPNDHTAGTKPGMKSPTAMAADNDLALGQIVDAVTHSRFFADTAIFVVEDDAQNGPDHVDCHRSPALVISPYTPRGKMDRRMYSTASVLRTIEAILGFSPMSQYDAASSPMAFEFSGTFDPTAFTARPATVPLDTVNPRAAPGSEESARLDFSHPDAAPDANLNDILYRAIQSRPSPGPTVRFGITSAGDDDDERPQAGPE
jgi:DNA-binding beta-propeller fold protein YncE/phospholipase C